MILIIDNYDSFTYNLVQYIGEIINNNSLMKLKVVRNDKITIKEIEKMLPVLRAIIISPGPGRPQQAGISNQLIKKFAGKISILGVCLGHQCIAEVFGAKIIIAKNIMHGKTSYIYHDHKTIYKNIEEPFIATRYHSLIVDSTHLPNELEVSAWTKEGEIMGIRCKSFKNNIIEGVQFHPESILTKSGKDLLKNFLSIAMEGKK